MSSQALDTLPWDRVTGDLVFPDRALSGRSLASLTLEFERHIGAKGGDLVVVQGKNASVTVAAWLAGVKAGRRVLLANPAHPREFFARFVQTEQALFVGDRRWLAEHANRDQTEILAFDEVSASEGSEATAEEWLMPGTTILLTSGTTGGSKAVEWSWTAVRHGAGNMALVGRFDESDTCVTALPLFHANALLVIVLAGMLAGSRVHVAEKFSARGFSTLMRNAGGTKTSLLGSMASRILSSDEESSQVVRMIVAPCDEPTASALQARYGCSVAQIYGQTDIAICLWNDDVSAEDSSAGGPLPGWEATVDATPESPVGELLVRNTLWDIGAIGYVDDPELTLASRRNFWFHTGDLFEKINGRFHYRGRTKDVLRVKGENVHAGEVESVLSSCSGIREAAVLGRSVGLGDEELVVVLETDLGAHEIVPALRDAVRSHLPVYAWPVAFGLTTKLPRTATQKVAKGELAGALPPLTRIDWFAHPDSDPSTRTS